MEAEKNNRSEKPKQQLNSYVKYSSIAFQMVIIIGLGSYGGYSIDKALEFKIPVFTILLILISTALALYTVFRSLK
jgi:hypothetical protein